LKVVGKKTRNVNDERRNENRGGNLKKLEGTRGNWKLRDRVRGGGLQKEWAKKSEARGGGAY